MCSLSRLRSLRAPPPSPQAPVAGKRLVGGGEVPGLSVRSARALGGRRERSAQASDVSGAERLRDALGGTRPEWVLLRASSARLRVGAHAPRELSLRCSAWPAQCSLPAWRTAPSPRPALGLMTLHSAEHARRSAHGPGGHRGGPTTSDRGPGAGRSTGAAPGACPPRPLRCLCCWVARSAAPGEGVGSAPHRLWGLVWGLSV